MKDKLIIFDMDNTILQSKIDFGWMSKEVMALLESRGFGAYRRETVAQTITAFCQSEDCDQELVDRIWDKVCEIETVGMDKAVSEPGAAEALTYLSQYAELAVLSNNTNAAIGDNLSRLGLAPHLSYVAGRNSVPLLKPSPLGMLHVMKQYPDIDKKNVITIGDAMIDARAAEAAGIKFVAYNRSRPEAWDELGIVPLLRLKEWTRESCDMLRSVFD